MFSKSGSLTWFRSFQTRTKTHVASAFIFYGVLFLDLRALFRPGGVLWFVWFLCSVCEIVRFRLCWRFHFRISIRKSSVSNRRIKMFLLISTHWLLVRRTCCLSVHGAASSSFVDVIETFPSGTVDFVAWSSPFSDYAAVSLQFGVPSWF